MIRKYIICAYIHGRYAWVYKNRLSKIEFDYSSDYQTIMNFPRYFFQDEEIVTVRNIILQQGGKIYELRDVFTLK